MVDCGSLWLSVADCGGLLGNTTRVTSHRTSWTSAGMEPFKVAPSGSQWLPVAPSGSQWLTVAHSGLQSSMEHSTIPQLSAAVDHLKDLKGLSNWRAHHHTKVRLFGWDGGSWIR